MNNQERWDGYGKSRVAEIRENPAGFQIDKCPSNHRAVTEDLKSRLGDLSGKRILDLGCGQGKFAVWLAKQGAEVTAVDLGPSLLESAAALAEVNGVSLTTQQGNIAELPVEGPFDIVTGLAILHHLTKEDARRAVSQCHRVLKPGGKAYFFEPVENSPTFEMIQNIIPAGGQRPRPSILQRRKWREYMDVLDDRSMSDRELRDAGEVFSGVELSHHGLLVRLARLIGCRNTLLAIDENLLRLPRMKRYSQAALAIYTK